MDTGLGELRDLRLLGTAALRCSPSPTPLSVRPVKETLKEYARATAGGLLFAIAPLYTMEIWWKGYVVPPAMMLVSGVLMFAVLVAYSYYAGLHDDKSFFNNVLETFETVALGTIISVILLKLAGQLPPEIEFYEAFGRITTEATSVSIGVAVGSAQLGESAGEDDEEQPNGTMWHELALAILGALLIAVGIAPTEEVLVIAVTATTWEVLGTAVLSFALAFGMINYAKFRGSGRYKESIFAGGPLGDAFVTYGLALALAAVLLWTGGAFEDLGLLTIMNQIVFLGVATTLGAAAGRLLLQ